MAPIVGSKQAEQLKQDGNNYFQKNRFGAAIDAYTEAITLCPNVPIYWTNRALCHRRRNDWRRVEEDCRRAIQLDHNSVKAHYYLGLALLQKEAFGEGVRELEKVYMSLTDVQIFVFQVSIHHIGAPHFCGFVSLRCLICIQTASSVCEFRLQTKMFMKMMM